MAFEKKTWTDRKTEFPGRRRLTDVETNEETVYDVERNEGEVLADGDAFSAENMNGLEDRIKEECDYVDLQLTPITQAQYDALGSGRPNRLYLIVG